MPGMIGASFDLGMGDALGQQQTDETEEERRKRLFGMSTNASSDGLSFGRSGVASSDLGMGGGGIRGMLGVGR